MSRWHKLLDPLRIGSSHTEGMLAQCFTELVPGCHRGVDSCGRSQTIWIQVALKLPLSLCMVMSVTFRYQLLN